jgi:hypothetical protein
VIAALAVAGCTSWRPTASQVAASKEAAARSAAAVPLGSYSLEILSPRSEAESRTSIPWIEIRGRAGTAELFESDLVIALDVSLSTHRPSGIDLDEDGVIGSLRGVVRSAGPRSLHPRGWTTDADDTIAEVEVEAARALILGLEQRRNRIGIVSYTDRGRVRAEVGRPGAALAAVDELRISDSSMGTSVAAGLRTSRELLQDLPSEPVPRDRAVLLFTDGKPTAPISEFLGALRAIEEASEFPQRGIDLYLFAFGPVSEDQARFLLELAGTAEGRLYKVGDPRRLLEDLPPVDLAPSWLELENVTTGEKGQGIRSTRDGRFDGFVPLSPGDNRIRLIAELADGRLQRWEQTVRYDAPETPSEEQRLATERVVQELRARSGDSEADAAAGPP